MARHANPVTRFFDGNKGRWKTAIAAMCAHCVGCTSSLQGGRTEDHIEPGFKDMIANCTVYGCPLRGFRPYQNRKEGETNVD